MDLKAHLNTNFQNLTEEEKDNICQLLTKDDLGKSLDVNDLRNALKLFQNTLKYKVTQLENLSEELDDFASKQGKEEARLHQEIEDLQAQLSKKHWESSGKDVAAEDDLRQLLHESELNSQNLLAELQAQEQEQLSNKMEMEKLESQLAVLENDRSQLKRELSALREEINEQHRDIEPQSQESQKTHQQLVESLRQKNKHLSLLLSDIESSEKENISLREKLTNIKIELSEATKNIIHTTGEIVTLQVTKEEQAEKSRYLERLCEALRHQVEDLVEEKHKRDRELESFEQEIDIRVQEWKDIVEKKEKELADFREQLANQSIKGQNIMKTCESEEIALLSQTLQKRECQIDELQSQLSQATKDLNDTTALLENLQQATEKSHIKQSFQDVKIIQKQLSTAEERIKVLESKLKDAENDAEGKSEEITKMIIQLRSYEAGEFGLSEALTQIKELTQQRSVRDQHIEQLVETANLLKSTCDALQEENLTLRELLNIPSGELVKTSPTVLKNQEQNVLKVQQQQIDRLEEDLISTRLDRRNLSQQVLVLSKQLQELEGHPPTQKTPSIKHTNRSMADARAASRKIRALQQEQHQLGIERQSLIEENESLRQGLHDILDSIHFQDGKSNVQLESKVLEHLLHALDSRHISGWYHPAMRIQAKVNTVEGNNEALREQLRSMRGEETRLLSELQQAKLRIAELERNMHEVDVLPSRNTEASFKTEDNQKDVSLSLHLPTELPAEGWNMISKMNKHLLQVLHDQKEGRGQVLETFSVQRELQYQLDGLVLQLEQIVKQQTLEKGKWAQEKAQLEEHLENIKTNLAASEAQVVQLRNLWESFSSNNDVQKEIILQDVFNISAISAEKEKLERIASFALHQANHAKMQVELIKKEWNESKKWIIRQFGELFQSKSSSILKLAQLESILVNCVHIDSLNAANSQTTEVTAKYSKLLRQYEITINRFDKNMKKLISELEVERKMRHDVTARLEEANRVICVSKYPSETTAEDMNSLPARIKSETFREKQQVLHAEKMCEIAKVEAQHLTERCQNLEKEVLTLLDANEQLKADSMKAQTRGITPDEKDTLESQLAQAKAEVQELQASKKHLQELADIAEAQVNMLEHLHERSELQLDALRQVNYKLQAESDLSSEIARLSEDLCAAQVRELAAWNQIAGLEKQLSKVDSLNGRQAKEILALQDTINISKLRNFEQCRKMQEEIMDLRQRAGNTLPLAFFHLTVTAFLQSSTECKNLWHDLQRAKADLINHSHDTEEIKNSCQQTLELQNALKAEHSDLDCQRRIESLASKLTDMKLKELQNSRQNLVLEADLKQTRERLQSQEILMAALEEQLLSLDITRMHTTFRREEGEKKCTNIKNTSVQENPLTILPAPISTDAQIENKPFDILSSNYETVHEPLSESMEILGGTKLLTGQLISLKEEIKELTKQLNAKNMELETYKKFCFDSHQSFSETKIVEQLNVPKEPPVIIQIETPQKTEQNTIAHNEVALQATVESLKNIVLQKENTICRYQKFLRDVREEDARIIGALQEHLRNQQADLTAQEQAYMRLKISMRHLSLETNNDSHSKAALDIQLARSNELEDEVALLTTKVSTLSSDFQTVQQEAAYWSTVARQHLSTIEELNHRLTDQNSMDVERKKPSFCLPYQDAATLSSSKSADLVTSEKNGSNRQESLKGLPKAKSHQVYSQLSAEITELKNKLHKMEEQERQYKIEIQRLRDQIPIYSRRSQLSHTESLLPERECELLKQVNHLEQQLKQVKSENENTMVLRTQQEIKKIKSVENVARWDERKKHQMQIERLKRSLQEQCDENTLLHEKLERMHATVHRLEREKIVLEQQVRNLHRVEQEKALLEDRLKTIGGNGVSQSMLNEIQGERDRLFMEVKMLRAKQSSANLENKENLSDLMQKERADLFKTNLELECENLELKLELEKMRAEAPCLHHKIIHLERLLLEAPGPKCEKHSSEGMQGTQNTQVEHENKALQKMVLQLTEELEIAKHQLKAMEGNNDAVKISALQAELRNKSLLLGKVKTLLERAAIQEKQLSKEVEMLKGSFIQRK